MTRLLVTLLLAGQLHVGTYGLKEVAARGDQVRLGVIGAVKPPEGSKKNREAAFTPEGGTPETIILYGGVVWTDPRKSPIDSRLRGATVPPPGTKVIAVPSVMGGYELLPADPANLRKRELLFDAGKRGAWLAGADSVLRADLDDRDLGELARAELSKRGTLTAADVLMGDEQLLYEHYRSLTPAQRRALLDEAVPLARARPAARARWFQLATLEPTAETIGALAQSLPGPDDTRGIADVRLALILTVHKGQVDLSPFADFLVVMERQRPAHQATDRELASLTAALDAPAKQKVALGFLEASTTSTRLFDGLDLFLVKSAVQLAREAPSIALLGPLEKWDLTKLGSSGRRFALAGLLGVAAAVAPLDVARVRALVEPILASPADLDAEAVAGYRAVVPPVVGSPSAFTVPTVGLGSRHLRPGAEVRFDSKAGVATLTVNFGKGDETKAFPLEGAWPTEWKTNGWTFTLERVTGTRFLKVSAAAP